MTVRQTIILRRTRRFVIAALILLCILDYARVLGYQGDDWRRFNGTTVSADEVIDNRTFRAGDTIIRLIGIAATPTDGGTFLRSKLAGRPVRLVIDQPQTRDDAGRLLASCYFSAGDCLNVSCIGDGGAWMDKTFPCSIQADLEAAAMKAKRKSAALWRKSQKVETQNLIRDD